MCKPTTAAFLTCQMWGREEQSVGRPVYLWSRQIPSFLTYQIWMKLPTSLLRTPSISIRGNGLRPPPMHLIGFCQYKRRGRNPFTWIPGERKTASPQNGHLPFCWQLPTKRRGGRFRFPFSWMSICNSLRI